MRHLLTGLLLTPSVCISVGAGSQQVVDNAVAFARLNGVVRYFIRVTLPPTSTGTVSPFMA